MLLEHVAPITRDGKPLRAVDLPRPQPGDGDVLLRVEVCAVCHTELDQIEGRVATPLPRVPGHQVIGEIIECSAGVDRRRIGQRIGVGWIASACGECRWCTRGEENLCPEFRATGRDIDGGYAEFMAAPAAFTVPIPETLRARDAAPMLCAGAIGLRAFRLAGLDNGEILGLTGFGGSNHLVLTLARALLPDSPVLIWARDPAQRRQALELGATWAGDTPDRAPHQPDAIIDTTPVWTPALEALTQLAPGGRLVINAIAKESSDRDQLAGLDYPSQLWREKQIRSVANVTRRDIADYLELAARHGFTPEHRVLTLDQANEALKTLRFGDFRGAFVLAAVDDS